jgi:GrpB-like predicted nucleotidyltransferase (UPF0157 family)
MEGIMIGLERGMVKIVPYSIEWKTEYKKEETLLYSLIGKHVLDIQHVGSTSIEGLDAKPIIDIAVAVRSLDDAENFRVILEDAGYLYRGNAGIEGHVLFVKGNEAIRTHHIHIEELNSTSWKNHIYFRDYLRLHRELVEEYLKLKKELAKKFSDERESYTASKDEFIKTVLGESEKYFSPLKSYGYAQVNGTRLYYEVKGEGEPLVLLHSGYTDMRLWDDQFDAFSKYFKVVRYDIRGFGNSDRPGEKFSHYEDLKALLDYLNIEKANFIGVSMGGSIVIEFALEHPDYVNSLILSGASLNGFNITVDEASKVRSELGMSIVTRDKDFDSSVDLMLKDPMWKQSNPIAHEHLKDMFMDTSLEWILGDIIQQANPPAAQRLSEINKKTLIIVGTEDSLPILEIAGFLQANITGAEKVFINSTGHLPNLDKPEEFNKHVLDFLLNN